jgi:histidinol dehydrogenase
MRTVKLTKDVSEDILKNLLKRSTTNYGEFEQRVAEIVDNVKENKDKALFDYTLKFDKCSLTKDTVRVSKEEIKEAYEKLDKEYIEVIKEAAANIADFHKRQLRNTWIETRPDGSILGQRITPLESTGCYVPGGKAAYPSSVLMNIVPAKVAGVQRIVMVTPPSAEGKVNPGTIVAADIAGATEIYKVGGAQAIAALAYGTESIPKVDKITGPGNIYVALAKKAVFGNVGIDSIAGPSEIVVLADESANPRFVAADLLSQAEHDEMASAILVTTSEKLANEVSDEVDGFLKVLSRENIIRASLDNFGYIIVADTIDEAINTVNDIASEHLEILTVNPFETMTKIKNAGAIFLGEYSSEPLGDYFAGPNHILPTNGTSRFFSPLSVDDFIKKTSIISYSKDALCKVHEKIELFAKNEGLTAHANSIAVRFEK